jgi:hypothetical protein
MARFGFRVLELQMDADNLSVFVCVCFRKGLCILESVSDSWVQAIKDVYPFQKPQPE